MAHPILSRRYDGVDNSTFWTFPISVGKHRISQ